MRKRILLGTNYYRAQPSVEERHSWGRESLLALDGVELVNVKFTDDTTRVTGFAALPALRMDALQASGESGPRKFLANEALDVLAARAGERDLEYFSRFL